MMAWTFLDTWIVITGVLSAMACALLGNYLVLRRMSMMGDAISHAVLPGLAIAFLVTGSRGSVAMLVGAVLIGLLTALLVQGLYRLSGLDRGAAMGVIFTTLFAIGLVLIRQAADYVDLDPSCVLYGAIELTPLDTTELLGFEIPRAALTSGGMLLINLLLVLAFYKELKITSFDPSLATTIGIDANRWHYVLMTMVAATTIVAFESVGSILVIAMLIVPGATAHLLTDRLSTMLIISLIIAASGRVARSHRRHYHPSLVRVSRHQHGRHDGRGRRRHFSGGVTTGAALRHYQPPAQPGLCRHPHHPRRYSGLPLPVS